MNISKAIQILETVIGNKEQEQAITPFLSGKPGIGKSQIVQQLKEKFQYDYLVDLRLSQHDNTDIKGIPKETNGQLVWLSPEFLPIEGSKYEGSSGILFFDEFNRARPDVMQSVFEIIHDRRIGMKKILPNWKIVCAGNYGYEDGCSVYDMDTALRNRLMIIDISEILLDPFLKWAESVELNKFVRGYLKLNPHKFVNYETENPVTPRSWEKFAKILDQNKGREKEIALMLGENIINGSTATFLEYLEKTEKINPNDILKNYKNIKSKLFNLERDDIYELNEKLINIIVEKVNDNTITGNEFKNFAQYAHELLNDDNKVSVLKELGSKNVSIVEKLINAMPITKEEAGKYTSLLSLSVLGLNITEELSKIGK